MQAEHDIEARLLLQPEHVGLGFVRFQTEVACSDPIRAHFRGDLSGSRLIEAGQSQTSIP
jgi:hypothetical protein